MDALFGKKRADAMRVTLEPLNPYERELTIVEELARALQETGGEICPPLPVQK
jgi:hypothetical protein